MHRRNCENSINVCYYQRYIKIQIKGNKGKNDCDTVCWISLGGCLQQWLTQHELSSTFFKKAATCCNLSSQESFTDCLCRFVGCEKKNLQDKAPSAVIQSQELSIMVSIHNGHKRLNTKAWIYKSMYCP